MYGQEGKEVRGEEESKKGKEKKTFFPISYTSEAMGSNKVDVK